ncbi:MAG: UDP-glucose 4-epimerase GalE [Oscillospiraceae bacterium]|nr:UDP-glucose 4-epimerase GalE [Oscillospiraceae bacterium]MBR1897931.1 UDP-glucose 4-epimerase GalE [Oscillospiraceae bacterium]
MGKILVTGGAGFIGSHTCVEFLESGYEVVVLDNLSNSKEESLRRVEQITGKKVTFYKADMRDAAAMKQIFAENEIDAVVHFAGLKAVGESVEKPLEYYENNLNGTFVLLAAMREAGCKRFVFSSSATVYGMHNPVPYVEDMPTSATNPYGYTKVMIEQILHDCCNADPEFSVVALRYFNPIGAHKSGLIGEDPNGIPNNLLPYIGQVAVGKREQLSVFGNDYDTPDGTGVRDYIHVVDLAKGHVCAIEYAAGHKGFMPINLGTGNGISVLEMVEAYSKACGFPIKYRIAPRRAGDIATSYADASRAKELLGWEAHETLETMCEDSWRFMQRNPNGL